MHHASHPVNQSSRAKGCSLNSRWSRQHSALLLLTAQFSHGCSAKNSFWLKFNQDCPCFPSSLFLHKVNIQQQLIHVQDAAQWSSQLASLMHEAWYSWHASLWQNRLCLVLPTAGPGLLHNACRSRLAADAVVASSTPIVHHQAKALQLQLLVRHMARCVFDSFDTALLIVYRTQDMLAAFMPLWKWLKSCAVIGVGDCQRSRLKPSAASHMV